MQEIEVPEFHAREFWNEARSFKEEQCQTSALKKEKAIKIIKEYNRGGEFIRATLYTSMELSQ
jgi:hypothetical protein